MGKWKSSIHMPFWASRLHLEIVKVWPSRLHDMTEEMVWQEGVFTIDRQTWTESFPNAKDRHFRALRTYVELWDRINGEKPGRRLSDNPWVWRIEFKRLGE